MTTDAFQTMHTVCMDLQLPLDAIGQPDGYKAEGRYHGDYENMRQQFRHRADYVRRLNILEMIMESPIQERVLEMLPDVRGLDLLLGKSAHSIYDSVPDDEQEGLKQLLLVKDYGKAFGRLGDKLAEAADRAPKHWPLQGESLADAINDIRFSQRALYYGAIAVGLIRYGKSISRLEKSQLAHGFTYFAGKEYMPESLKQIFLQALQLAQKQLPGSIEAASE